MAAGRKRLWRWVCFTALCVFVGAVIGFLFLFSGGTVSPKPLSWRMQPDQFPLGTVLQGSRVELSFGAFSGLRPAPMPGGITALPAPLRKPCEWGMEEFRTFKAKVEWRLKPEVPEFLKIEKAGMEFHTSQGPLVYGEVSLKSDRVGGFAGNLVLRVTSQTYADTNLIVPVSVTVVRAAASPPRKVLVTQTPYDCYSTGNGRDFEPLAGLVTRLSAKGIGVDFLRQLPSSLTGYSTILVCEATLVLLTPAQTSKLNEFVAQGGRLILAADAFFAFTTPKANAILKSYGLQIASQEIRGAVTNTTVIPDSLTTGVRRLDFWRPAPIQVTDPSQARLLVMSDDGEGGLAAVSRPPGRGEVIIVTQSLWWNWIRSDSAKAGNCLLLENFLTR